MDSIKILKDLFSKFPTIGPRTASRFVFYLISLPPGKIEDLIQALQFLKNNVKLCQFCFNPHESSEKLCLICKDPLRNQQTLCIVEKENDLISIENTKKYKGIYFILGMGAISYKKDIISHLKINDLKERIKDPSKFRLREKSFKEIIIATNPTPEGKMASLLVEKAIKETGIQGALITHLAKGLPVGGELEYADEETLESAFEGRK